MNTLEQDLIRGLNNVKKEINDLNDREEYLRESLKAKHCDRLETTYQIDSPLAEAADSRTHIQSIVDRIEEFTRKRQFYQQQQAIEAVLTKIKEHHSAFSVETLESKIFTSIKAGLNSHFRSVEIMQKSANALTTISKLNQSSSRRDLENWAKNLESFSEEIEDNLPFFSTKVFDELAIMCEEIIIKCRQKRESNFKREEFRRRLRYAAGFLLNIIEIAQQEAEEEDEEIIQSFFAISQSSLKDAWEK
jgi:hypothetical protein